MKQILKKKRLLPIFVLLLLGTACNDRNSDNDNALSDSVKQAPIKSDVSIVKEQDKDEPTDQPLVMFPTYQMRDEVLESNRLASTDSAAALFSNRCGYCHLAAGMGTNILTGQRMALGEAPEMGLLTNRQDLLSEYVRVVVRNGKNAMPPLSRVDVTDAELDLIAHYLEKAGQ